MKLTGGRALELFKSEFRYLQGVSHPNLVQLYGLEVDECGRWLLTMEYVEGTDLKKHLGIANPKEQIGAIPTIATSTTNDSLCSGDELKSEETHARHPAVTDSHSHIETPPSRRIPVASRVPASNQAHIRETFAQLAQGIAALHVHRRIHRDLKPQNVLVEKSGRVVILDFGLTAALDNTDEYMASALAGTASYMAPEQAASTPVASPASDWYAFGVMLYESLAGGLPFTETRFHQLQQQKLAGVSTRPSQTNSGVDLELEQLCLGLLAPEPTMRPGVDDIMGVFGIDTSGQKSASQLLSSPLFGRESHLQMLRSAWFNMAKGVEGGIASVVRLHGPSGMGKSTLVSHFLEELRTQQILVLSGKCYEHESVPFKALDPVVDALAGYLDSLADNDIASLIPAECSPLLRVFPVLDRVRAIQQAASAENRFFDPQELRQKAFSGLRELLNRLANRKPIVIHIDDLQWGDADSWLLLSDLLRSPSGPGILWLLAHRSEDTDSTRLK
jgi:serine/threonine protein kinase